MMDLNIIGLNLLIFYSNVIYSTALGEGPYSFDAIELGSQFCGPPRISKFLSL